MLGKELSGVEVFCLHLSRFSFSFTSSWTVYLYLYADCLSKFLAIFWITQILVLVEKHLLSILTDGWNQCWTGITYFWYHAGIWIYQSCLYGMQEHKLGFKYRLGTCMPFVWVRMFKSPSRLFTTQMLLLGDLQLVITLGRWFEQVLDMSPIFNTMWVCIMRILYRFFILVGAGYLNIFLFLINQSRTLISR